MSGLAAGDILCAASDVDDSNIDLRNHRGPGRILHYDRDFNLKGALWTGEVGLLVGLARAPGGGALYAADPNRRMVFRFDGEGRLLGPMEALPDRPWGTVGFAPDGAAYLGVHTQRGPAPQDEHGEAKLMRFDPASGRVVEAFPVETDGGRTGWHGLTSLAFQDGGRVAVYVSEAGRRVPRYDLAARRQLEDLLVFAEDDPRRAYGVASVAGGRMLVAAGRSCLVVEDGQITAEWPADPQKGWTRVTPSPDGRTVFFGNFLEGVLERRALDTGEVLQRHDIGRKCALCGVVEVGEPQGEVT